MSNNKPNKMGRPKSASPKNVMIHIRVKPETKEELSEIADDLGLPVSALINMWILEKTKEHKA